MQLNTEPKQDKLLVKCVIGNVNNDRSNLSKLPPRLTVRGNNVVIEIPTQNYIDIISIMHKNDFHFSTMWKHTAEKDKAVMLICLFGLAGCASLLEQLNAFALQKAVFPLSKLVKLRCVVCDSQTGLDEYHIVDIIGELIITINNFVSSNISQARKILDTLVKIKVQT